MKLNGWQRLWGVCFAVSSLIFLAVIVSHYKWTLTWGFEITKDDVVARLKPNDSDTQSATKASTQTKTEGTKFRTVVATGYGHEYHFKDGDFTDAEISRIVDKMAAALEKAEGDFGNNQMPVGRFLTWAALWIALWTIVYLLGLSVAWVRIGFSRNLS
jgi:cytoskeletal protein RodZ